MAIGSGAVPDLINRIGVTLIRTRTVAWKYAAIPFSILIGLNSTSAQISMAPAEPTPLGTVRMQVAQGALGPDSEGLPASIDGSQTTITMQSNKIVVSLVIMPNTGFGGAPFPPLDIPLGQFPQGTYTVEVVKRSPQGAPLGSIGSTTFLIPAVRPTGPLWNHSDIWWGRRSPVGA